MTLRSIFFASVATCSLFVFISLSVFAVGVSSQNNSSLNNPLHLVPQTQQAPFIEAKLPEIKEKTEISSSLVTLAVGNRIKVVHSSANTRLDGCGAVVSVVSNGAQGSIISGPLTCGGLVRWNIQWDSGSTSWIAESDGVSKLIDKVIFKFIQNNRVYSTATGNGVDTGLVVRTGACSAAISRKVPLNAKGKIISSSPTTAVNCLLGSELLYWWNIEWYDSANNIIITGWSAENFVEKDTTPIPDVTPPTVNILNSINSTFYTLNNLPKAIEVQAQDQQTFVTNVELYLNGLYLANDDTAANGWKFTIEPLPAGIYTLQARALDAAANASLSSVITLNVLNKDTPDYTTTVVKNTDGEVVNSKFDYFSLAGIVRYSGTVETLNSCTKIVSTQLLTSATTSKLKITTDLVMPEDSVCSMGTNIMSFDSLNVVTYSHQQLAEFNSLFVIQ